MQLSAQVKRYTIILSGNTVSEDAATGTAVGTLSVSSGQTGYTFTIIDDPDDKFAIDGNALETDATLNFDTATQHDVTIRATKAGKVTRDATFTILVGDATDADPIFPLVTPSRTSGVAPLAVHVSAVGTTATGITNPFHELSYQWDFGDAGAGDYAYGAHKDKNAPIGPIAAYVYETPGEYEITVTVSSGTGSEQSAPITITVDDPDVVFATTNTICVRSEATGDFTGAPSGSTQVTQADWPTIVSTYVATGKRVLLRRGDTFTTVGAGASFNETGPVTIGAFGTGADPIISVSTAGVGSTGVIQLASGLTDCRFMDIEIDGNNDNGKAGVQNLSTAATQNILLLRMTILETGIGVIITTNAATLPRYFFVVDSEIGNLMGDSGDNAVFVKSAHGFALLGNNIHDNLEGEHLVRPQSVEYSIFNNNRLHEPATTGTTARAAFTLRCPEINEALTRTQYIVVNHNEQTMGSNGAGGLSIAPSNDNPLNPSFTSYAENIILDGNQIQLSAAVRAGMSIDAVNVTFRNNLIWTAESLTSALTFTGVSVNWRQDAYDAVGAEQTTNIWIYNNTVSLPGVTGALRFMAASAESDIGAVFIHNNAIYIPNGSAGTVLTVPATSEITASNNPSDAQMRTLNPLWADGSGNLNLWTDFELGVSSPYLNGGTIGATQRAGNILDALVATKNFAAPDGGALEA
jgi:hypothetical protein